MTKQRCSRAARVESTAGMGDIGRDTGRSDGRNRRAAETRRKIIEAAKAMIAETGTAPTVVACGQAGRRLGPVGFPAFW